MKQICFESKEFLIKHKEDLKEGIQHFVSVVNWDEVPLYVRHDILLLAKESLDCTWEYFVEGLDYIPIELYASLPVETFKCPDSVTEIEPKAFSGCLALKHVDLNNVTAIGHFAFSRCDNLKSVYVSNKVLILPHRFPIFSDKTTVECDRGSEIEQYCIENKFKYANI